MHRPIRMMTRPPCLTRASPAPRRPPCRRWSPSGSPTASPHASAARSTPARCAPAIGCRPSSASPRRTASRAPSCARRCTSCKSRGLLRSRQGSGVYVTARARPRRSSSTSALIASIDDVMRVREVRRALEAETAALAAERRDARSRSRRCARRCARSTAAPPRRATASTRTSPSIASLAQAAGNPHFGRILEFLEQYSERSDARDPAQRRDPRRLRRGGAPRAPCHRRRHRRRRPGAWRGAAPSSTCAAATGGCVPPRRSSPRPEETESMNILITGGGGFIGSRLARALLAIAASSAAGRSSASSSPTRSRRGAELTSDNARRGARRRAARAMRGARPAKASTASSISPRRCRGECEADFDLGLRSNLDTTRALLDALRAATGAAQAGAAGVLRARSRCSGPTRRMPLPALVGDDTLPAPQTSYGTQKLICEHLIADYSRKGFIDGRSARLMTVTVRPGRPNGAASSFFCGIIREPLAGVEAICPVPADGVASADVGGAHGRGPDRRLRGERRAASAAALALNLPAVNVHRRPDARRARGSRRHGGARAGALRARRASSPASSATGRAARPPSAPARPRPACRQSFADIIRQYIADCRAGARRARAGLAERTLA